MASRVETEHSVLPHEWLFRHSDFYHPGTRQTCNHCQEMIRIFGRLLSHETLAQALCLHSGFR